MVWNVHAISRELDELLIAFFFTKMDADCIYFFIDFIHVQLIFYVAVTSVDQKKFPSFLLVLLMSKYFDL